ncbi:MAG: hypothetical protein MUF20_05975 [Methylotetracoccus sp.]|nr:hypothetical protein [Methylotetracoccus sp.]
MIASNRAGGALVTDVNVREHFRDSIHSALTHQKVEATEDTVYYVVNLLAHYTHAENLFSQTAEGVDLKPLALIYAEAVEAQSAEERHTALKRLGDIALLISGLFSSSLNRKRRLLHGHGRQRLRSSQRYQPRHRARSGLLRDFR